MREHIYSISDIEMGRGDITDDFTDDQAIADFVDRILAEHKGHSSDQKITLILNGDIFDFLKMEYKGELPRHITEEISLWKLEEVIKAHPRVFQAFKKFLAESKTHHIYFVIGNHDADLIWPALQERVKQELFPSNATSTNRVTFDYWYTNGPIHAEHGHLQDTVFANRTHRPIVNYKNKKILNLPWGSYACFSHLVHFKKKYPKEEQLFPHSAALASNKAFARDAKKLVLGMAPHLLINSIIRWNDPSYRVPYAAIAGHILRHGFEFADDNKLIDHRVKQLTRKNPDKKILLLGHAHLFNKVQHKDQTILITDTWRDEYDLTKNKTKKPKTYARVIMEHGTITSADIHTFTK